MGHSEPASGLCSLAKIVIALETGKIPGNLHFANPNPDIPALLDGRLQVINDYNIYIFDQYLMRILITGCK